MLHASLLIEKLYYKHKNSLFAYAKRLTKNNEIAIDIVHTVFENAMKNAKTISRIQEEQKIKAYLNTAVRNTAINYYKKQNSISMFPIEEYADSENVELTVIKKEAYKHLNEVMKTLSPNEYDSVILHYYVGLKHKEIGKVLNLSTPNISKIIQRARDKLRDRLAEDDYWGGAY